MIVGLNGRHQTGVPSPDNKDITIQFLFHIHFSSSPVHWTPFHSFCSRRRIRRADPVDQCPNVSQFLNSFDRFQNPVNFTRAQDTRHTVLEFFHKFLPAKRSLRAAGWVVRKFPLENPCVPETHFNRAQIFILIGFFVRTAFPCKLNLSTNG